MIMEIFQPPTNSKMMIVHGQFIGKVKNLSIELHYIDQISIYLALTPYIDFPRSSITDNPLKSIK
jgi:hypothetical protein